MAITLREMIEHTRERFHLKLLSGGDALDYIVTWAHMAEDASVGEFFWGNELVVTSGYSCRDADSLKRFISTLAAHHCSGIVINTGKYIELISEEVISFCNARDIPLFSMPWEMSITEFVRECCWLINKSSRDDADLAQAVIHAIVSPQESGRDQQALGDYFDLEEGFVLVAIQAEQLERDSMLDQLRILRLHTAMQPFDFPYLILHHDKRFCVLMNQTDLSLAQAAAQRILETSHSALPNLPIYLGIGDPFYGLSRLSDCYNTAISAVRCAALQQIPTVRFRDMGFYRLLYSVPDDGLLLNYYQETMAPLLDYDRVHNGCYAETLFRYVLSGGSLQQVASQMYTHRNTVSYRMGKIRELIQVPLETPGDYLPYLMAYHCGLILKQIAPLGA